MPTLADLLVDFGKPPGGRTVFADDAGMQFSAGEGFAIAPEARGEAAETSFDMEPDGAWQAPEAPDVEQLVAEAVADAEAELRQALEAEFAGRLEAERALHLDELERLRREFGQASGETLLRGLEAIEERVTRHTSEVVARLVAPVLTQSLQDRAIAGLADIIGEAIRESGAVRIRVRGPLSLFEALDTAFGEHAGRLEYTETDSFDLEVSIDESLYETRLSEWSHSLSEALQ